MSSLDYWEDLGTHLHSKGWHKGNHHVGHLSAVSSHGGDIKATLKVNLKSIGLVDRLDTTAELILAKCILASPEP